MVVDLLYTGDLPANAYPGDAGYDLPIVGEHILSPGQYEDLPSGIALAIPTGFYGRIIGRSSALRKRKIRVYEGIIDAGFRGQLYSYVENVGKTATRLGPEDRVAQLILCPIVESVRVPVVQLPMSVRGTNGFGSSDARVVPSGMAEVDTGAYHGTFSMPTYEPSVMSPLVYLGGPIDHADDWQGEVAAMLNQEGFRVYDPRVENQGKTSVSAIFDHNMAVLRSADLSFFVFDTPGAYGFGSPIEVARAAGWGKPVVVVHPEQPAAGVYLRYYWQEHGVLIYPTIQEALADRQRWWPRG